LLKLSGYWQLACIISVILLAAFLFPELEVVHSLVHNLSRDCLAVEADSHIELGATRGHLHKIERASGGALLVEKSAEFGKLILWNLMFKSTYFSYVLLDFE
jgi:hypothetical protein